MIYKAILDIAEFLLRRKKAFFLILSLFSVTALTLIALFILQDFPNSADEYGYIYQAETFLAGRFWNKAHPLYDFFLFCWQMIYKGERAFTQYFPGWPLVLAAAMFLRIPIYVVNPALGTLSLLALFCLGRKIHNEKIAVLSILITAVSAFFIFNSASYFAHTLCSLLILLFTYHILCFVDENKIYSALLSGIFLGAALITRPYSAILCAVPILVYLLVRMFLKEVKQPAKIIWFFIGVLPFLLFLLFYNYHVTDRAFVAPMMLCPNPSFELSLRGLQYTLLDFKNFMMWTPPLLLIIYFACLPHFLKEPKENIIALVPFSLAIGYLFYTAYGGEGYGHAGNEYGARYYYEGFPFLVLFVASRLFAEDSYSRKSTTGKFLFLLFVLSLILSIPLSIRHFMEERQVIWERKDLYRLVDEKKIENAVVFLKTGTGAKRPMPINDLLRNGLDYSNSVLYAFDKGMDNGALMRYYPDRDYYLYHYDKNSNTGYLKKIK